MYIFNTSIKASLIELTENIQNIYFKNMKLDGKDKLSTISLLQYLHGIVMFIFIFFLNNFISARFMGQHTERQYQLKKPR